jgi:hypothetical protein
VCPPPATVGRELNGFVPPYTSCTITPASAVVTPNTPVPFTITFVTTYNYLPPTAAALPGGTLPGSALRWPSGSMRFPALAGALALMAMVLIFVARASRRRFGVPSSPHKDSSRDSIGSQVALAARTSQPRGRDARVTQTTRRLDHRRFRLQFVTPAFSLALVGLVLLGACHKNYVNPAIETTPAGITTMNVTATSQGASRGVPITLDVVKHVPTLPGVVSSGAH